LTPFLQKTGKKNLAKVEQHDILEYVAELEHRKISAKGHLYVLINYFRSISNLELLSFCAGLREQRTQKTRRVFSLKDFLEVDPAYVQKLQILNIKTVDNMLASGRLKKQREQLAKQLEIPEAAILELVKLSDLTRLG